MQAPASQPHIVEREIRATRPRPALDAMRAAYLALLKLSLCDLAGAGTIAVGRQENGRACARDLPPDQRYLRVNGMDWPLNGLTMTGLARLDDLQRCVESVVAESVEGDLIEAGAWRGGSSILMRAVLDALGDERLVWVADSFEGFRAREGDAEQEGSESADLPMFDFLSVSLEEVAAHFARFGLDQGLEFVRGYFEQTMPTLTGRRWALVRLDGDTYEATRVTLDSLYPGLAKGGYVIVDDYGALDECRHAVDDFRAENGVTEPLEQVDWTCRRWRRDTEPDPVEPGGAAPPGGAAELSEPTRQRTWIPTAHERDLEVEVESLREQLRAARGEGSSPLRRPASWVRRRARRDG